MPFMIRSFRLAKSAWPEYNAEAAKEDELTIVVQVNGKLRGKLTVPEDTDDERLKELALADEKVIPHLGGRESKKIIVVKKKLVNIVV